MDRSNICPDCGGDIFFGSNGTQCQCGRVEVRAKDVADAPLVRVEYIKRGGGKPGPRAAERVAELMRRAGLTVPKSLTVHRVYAGRHQRAGGAWSWYATDGEGNEVVGACEPIGELWRERDRVRSSWYDKELRFATRTPELFV